jgi:hypothetical protein
MKNLLSVLFLTLASFQANSQCISGDCQNGNGKMKYDNGTYEGMFYNGQKHGHGTYIWNDSSQYIGAFLNNERTGRGIYICKSYMYDGEYINGVKSGYGKYQYLDRYSKKQYYEGSFVDDYFHGFGTLYYKSGDIYTGSFQSGWLWGYGILKKADDEIDMGVFKEDRQVDNHIIIKSDGTRKYMLF